jgi:hypothetical protein
VAWPISAAPRLCEPRPQRRGPQSRAVLERASFREPLRPSASMMGRNENLRATSSPTAATYFGAVLGAPISCAQSSRIGHLSAPCVMVALAGIVHDREAAAGHEHNRAEDNQQGSLHVDDLRCCGPPTYWPLNYPDLNERTMNAPEPSHRPKVPARNGHSGRGGQFLPILIGSPTAVAIVPAPLSTFTIISASCSTHTILVRASSPGILARHKPEGFMARRVMPSHVGPRHGPFLNRRDTGHVRLGGC